MKVGIKVIKKNLPKKGFQKETSHHIYYHHEYNGRKTGAYTYISHGASHKEVDGDILTKMRKQLKLQTNRQAANLFECPLDGNDYNQLLIQSGFISSQS